MKQFQTSFLATLSALLLAVLFACGTMNIAAAADTVTYWDPVKQEDCTPEASVTEVDSSTISWTDGNWYTVTDNVEISDRIEVTGTVNLILCDGAELNAVQGIRVSGGSGYESDNALIIWTDKKDGSGKLNAGGSSIADYSAGIGGDEGGISACGTVTINGGNVTAKGGGCAAGIGGGYQGQGCTLTVNGGNVTAIGGSYAAGIGGGYVFSGKTVTINGGTVTAIAGTDAVAIGAGATTGWTVSGSVYHGDLTLNGTMKVTAGSTQNNAKPVSASQRVDKCREKYAKIEPCGHNYVNHKCEWCGLLDQPVSYVDENGVNQGEKTCFSAESTAVWTDGNWYSMTEDVTINTRTQVNGTVNLILRDGMTLTAKEGILLMALRGNNHLILWSETKDGTGSLIANSKENEAAIGGTGVGGGGTLTVHGGNIVATGGDSGAGIGGGQGYSIGERGGMVTVYGGTVTANGGKGAAGIGGGFSKIGYGGDGGTVAVYGGTVTANGGAGAAGIGGGMSTPYEENGNIYGGEGGSGGKVDISGGIVTAKGGENAVAIGGGYGENGSGSPADLTLYETAKVTAGPAADNASLVAPDKKVDQCQEQIYTHIEPCVDHSDTYKTTPTTHKGTCGWCGRALDAENHSWKDGKCTVCEYQHVHSWTIIASGNKATVKCPADGCTNSGPHTATLTAKGGTENGKAYTATLTKSTGFPADVKVSKITYYKGKTSLTAAPKDAGTYAAQATVGSKAIRQEFTIQPKSETHVAGKAVLENTIPATCMKAGFHDVVTYCTKCGMEMSRKKVTDPALKHKWGSWTKLNAKQHQRVCARDKSHVEKANHTWDKGKVTRQATCTGIGVKTNTCTVCKATKTESIKALGHDYGAWKKLDAKQHQRTCSHDKTHIQKQAHTWGKGKITKMATATKAGVRTYTCTVCKTTKTEEIPAAGIILPGLSTTGNRSITLTWNKVNGAEGYDIFLARCNHTKTAKDRWTVKTLKGNNTFSWTKNNLKKHVAYKARVKAWVMQDGKKRYVSASPTSHAYTGGYRDKYTNPKSVKVAKTKVTLKVRKTWTIKAKVTKLKKNLKHMPTSHAPLLRYTSTNSKVAKVNGSGKVTAKSKGTCQIIVYAANGASKTVTVTVK